MAYKDIPLELRQLNQWVVWRYEEREKSAKPTKVPYDAKTGRLAKSNDLATASDFDTAVHYSVDPENEMDGIGLILTANDPYSMIDFDDPGDDANILDKQRSALEHLDSYTEYSPSGKGLHTVVIGSVPNGRKRGNIEVYFTGRFMTFTGEVFRDLPVRERQQQLTELWESLANPKSKTTTVRAASNPDETNAINAGLDEEKLTDQQVIDFAGSYRNSTLFNDLYHEGMWQEYYPSQSEADFALFDIIAYFSQNGLQTQRIYLKSKLAQREKSRAQYRINYMLARAFDNMEVPTDIEKLRNEAILMTAKAKKETMKKEKEPSAAEVMHKSIYQKFNLNGYSVEFPEGLVGEIAQFIFESSPRPIKEVALIGALGLMAGITGRSYKIRGAGLNQFMILLGRTGIGKDSMEIGMDKIIAAVSQLAPGSHKFKGPGNIASAPALARHLASESNSFVSVFGEFGLKLNQMVGPRASPALSDLKTTLMSLYSRSGTSMHSSGTVYSNSEKDIGAVISPAVTILGESTEKAYYAALNETLLDDGFLPRFLTITYVGRRPEYNEFAYKVQPSSALIQAVAELCANSIKLNSTDNHIEVMMTEEANLLAKQFGTYADRMYDTLIDNPSSNMWNRAHLKILKLSGTIAVGRNPLSPKVQKSDILWAIDLVRADIHRFSEKHMKGEIGEGNFEIQQLNDLMAIIKEYLESDFSEVEKCLGGLGKEVHENKIVPYGYLQRKTTGKTSYRQHRNGCAAALKNAIEILVRNDDIQMVGRAEMMALGTKALGYMVSNFNTFGYGGENDS